MDTMDTSTATGKTYSLLDLRTYEYHHFDGFGGEDLARNHKPSTSLAFVSLSGFHAYFKVERGGLV